MARGTVKTNAVMHQPMVLGEDGKWYFLPKDATFDEGTKVTFEEDVKPNPPPGFYWAKSVARISWAALSRPSAGPAPPTTVAQTPKEEEPAPTIQASNESATTQTAPASTGPPAAQTAPPAPKKEADTGPPPFSSRQVREDYDAIHRKLAEMHWSGRYGPSVQVQTKLKWDVKECRELYLRIKGELHDEKIPGTRLYYYVGAIGNWGKAGFRITGHSKPAAKVKASETHGVLHVEND